MGRIIGEPFEVATNYLDNLHVGIQIKIGTLSNFVNNDFIVSCETRYWAFSCYDGYSAVLSERWDIPLQTFIKVWTQFEGFRENLSLRG